MTNMVKKIAVFLALVMIMCSFVACNTPKEEVDNETVAENTEVVNVQPGNVKGKVLTNNGDMTAAGIIIVDEENNSYLQTTNELGGYHLKLGPGKYHLTFTKGFEFSTYEIDVEVESLKTYFIKDIRLTRLIDTDSLGWVAGDLHQHTSYSDGADSVDELAVANAAANLTFGFLTDHNTSRGNPEYRDANNRVYVDENGVVKYLTGFSGTEVTSEFGHFQSLGTGITFDKYEINFTDAERSSKDSKEYAKEKIIYIGEQIRRQGGLSQINHPYSLTNMGAMNFLAVDDYDIFSKFDTIEIWNSYFIVPDGRFTDKNTDNQNYQSKMLWFSILNNMKNGGSFIAATSGTDNHDSSGYASGSVRDAFVSSFAKASEYQNYCRYYGKYSGSVCTYIYLNGRELTQEVVLECIKNGNSFLTNGPILDCKIGDSVYGNHVVANDGIVTISNNIYCRDGFSEIRYIVNGEIVKTINVDNETSYGEDVEISNLNPSDWLVIEVLGDNAIYAISNPFFID